MDRHTLTSEGSTYRSATQESTQRISSAETCERERIDRSELNAVRLIHQPVSAGWDINGGSSPNRLSLCLSSESISIEPSPERSRPQIRTTLYTIEDAHDLDDFAISRILTPIVPIIDILIYLLYTADIVSIDITATALTLKLKISLWTLLLQTLMTNTPERVMRLVLSDRTIVPAQVTKREQQSVHVVCPLLPTRS